MPTDKSSTRRNFLKTTGVAASLAAIPTMATAETKINGEEAGINRALKSMVRQGRLEQAHDLATRHGVRTAYGSATLPSFDGEVGTQDAFSKSNSTISTYGWYKYDDAEGQEIYDANVWVDIEEDECQLIDDAAPKDAVALYWSDDQFQGVSESESNYGEIGYDTHLQSYEDYLRYGVWAKVKDNAVQDSNIACDGNAGSFTCGISTDIEKLEYGNKFNVTGEYLHNWNPGGLYYISSFSLGPFGFNFGGTNVYKWRKEETIKF